jgi:uncharacterized protein (TIGR00369 family)
MERKRTFEWQDPACAKWALIQLSGLDYLNGINQGKIPAPPLMHTLDFNPSQIEKGEAIFSFMPQEFHYNPLGSVHGGVISAILDTAMGCSLHSLLEACVAYTTLELKVNFLKAVTIKTGTMKAIGKVIHFGKRTGLIEARLIDSGSVVYAHSTCTSMILK